MPVKTPVYIYNNEKKKNHSVVTAMIGSEIRAAIQNWRKENKLPIDFRIPTLYMYFTKPIIKTAVVEGVTDVGTANHLFETCLIDKVEFMNPLDEVQMVDTRNPRWNNILDGLQLKDYDVIFWSPLGGTIGFANPTKDNVKIIQKEVDTAVEKEYYNHYI